MDGEQDYNERRVRDGDLITFVVNGSELGAGEARQVGTNTIFVVNHRQYALDEEGTCWIRGWHTREGPTGLTGPTGPVGIPGYAICATTSTGASRGP